jgi:hypothetical protein
MKRLDCSLLLRCAQADAIELRSCELRRPGGRGFRPAGIEDLLWTAIVSGIGAVCFEIFYRFRAYRSILNGFETPGGVLGHRPSPPGRPADGD